MFSIKYFYRAGWRFAAVFAIITVLTKTVWSVSVMEAVVVRAGEEAILPCPGINNNNNSRDVYGEISGVYAVNRLIWRCPRQPRCAASDSQGRLAEFTSRSVYIVGDRDRVSLQRVNWALRLSPAQARDTAEYHCQLNSQENSQRVVKLTVLDVPSVPGRPIITRHTSRAVRLSWTPSFQNNNSPLLHYIVQIREGEQGEWPSLETGVQTPGLETNITIDSLLPFHVYTFRVVAVNGIGVSDASKPSYPVNTLREKPSQAPRFVLAENRSSTAVEVGWRPPPLHTIHGEFLGYVLRYRRVNVRPTSSSFSMNFGAPSEDTPAQVVNIRNSSVQNYLIENLLPFEEYEVSLQVRNPKDLGPSASVKVKTDEAVPSAPRNVSVETVQEDSIALSWLAPRHTNGFIRGYSVYASTPGKTTRKLLLEGDTTHYMIINKLEPDTEYRVWVKAITRVGEGEESSSLSVVTDVSGPSAPLLTNVSCPNSDTIQVHWNRPEKYYRSVDMYFVLYRSLDQKQYTERIIPVQSQKDKYSINIPNLKKDQKYDLRIQGATKSRLVPNKLHKGHRSISNMILLERGCALAESLGRWKQAAYMPMFLPHIAILLIVLAAFVMTSLVVIIWRRRRKGVTSLAQCIPSLPPGVPLIAGWRAESDQAVAVHLFEDHVRRMHLDSDDGFRRQWLSLQTADGDRDFGGGAVNGKRTIGSATGKDKLRQVRIKSQPAHGVTPLSAYYVDGFRQNATFIVAEKPGTNQYDSVWKLIWQHKVELIVLIGRVSTVGERFWPEVGCIRPLGKYQFVEGTSRCNLTVCTIRNFNIYHTQTCGNGRRRVRSVRLYQYREWPEYGLPANPSSLLQFVQRTMHAKARASATAAVGMTKAVATTSPSTSPLLVVSGTSYNSNSGIYTALYSLLQQVQHSKEIGVYSYWKHCLYQCPYFLTNAQEYAFIHDCLLEIVIVGDTVVRLKQAAVYLQGLQSYCYTNAGSTLPNTTNAEIQYKQVTASELPFVTVMSAAKSNNLAKNRSCAYIPSEISRVLLSPRHNIEDSDYINASWLPGLYHSQEYILTQHPLPNTVHDFWQTLWDHRIITVACLTAEDCDLFWPLEDELIECDMFTVRYLSVSAGCSATYKASWTIRSFLMESLDQKESTLTVRIVFLPMWPGCSSLDAVMESVIGVDDVHSNKHTPLLVMDRYGATEAATFCVLTTVLRQLQFESCFDIYSYAKLYHQHRPGIWKTMRDLLFMYGAVEAWLRTGTVPSAGTYRADSCTSLCQHDFRSSQTPNHTNMAIV